MGQTDRRTPFDRLAGLVPIDAVIRNVDVQAVVDRIDLDALLERIDVNAVVERVDVDEVVARMNLTLLMEQSVRGAASGSLDLLRAQGARLDAWITTGVDHLLRRRPGWRPAQPPATASGDDA